MMAKRSIVGAGLVLLVLTPLRAAALNGSIGLYADLDATQTHASFNIGIPTTIYIIATLDGETAGGITGAEFRVTGLPPGWLASVTPNPGAGITMGDPFHPTGDYWRANIAFATCQTGTNGHVLLYTVSILPTSEVTNHPLNVEAGDPPSNPLFDAPLLLRCDPPIFTKVVVDGGQFVINMGPDYAVSSCDLGVSDPSPALGQPIYFQAWVRNVGALGAPTPVLVRFLLDSLTVGVDVPAGPIPAGDSVLVLSSLPWSTDFEPHILTVRIDPDTLQEFTWANNEATCRFPYDLHPVAIPACPPEAASMFSSCSPCVGDTVSIRAVVTNTGAFAVDSVRVEFRDGLGGLVTLGTVEVFDVRNRGDCAPASSRSATLQHSFARLGNHPIEVVVDPGDSWPEYDESNNMYMQTLEVPCLPGVWFDHAVSSCDVGVSDPSPALGQPIHFQAWVRNVGALAAPDPVLVRFLLDGLAVGADVPAGPLPAGDSVLVSSSVPWSTDFALHLLTVKIDPDTLQQDFTRANNEADCRLPYDLHPVAIPACPPAAGSMFSSCSPCVGDTVSIRAVVINTGAFAVDSVRVEFRDRLRGVFSLGSVAVLDVRNRGDCAPVSSSSAILQHVFARRGNHPIEVVVDPEDSWPEHDESDNVYVQTLEVPCLPEVWFDYAVSSCDLRVSDPSPALGQPIHFQAWVHSVGTVAAPSPVFVRFLLDSLIVGADVPTGPIPTGDSVLVSSSLPWSTDFALHLLTVRIDPDTLQEEITRTNNEAGCRLPYDLQPVAIPTCPPAVGSMFSVCTPCVEDTIAIRAVVTNTGAFAVDSVLVEFRDGRENLRTLGRVAVLDVRNRGECAPASSDTAMMRDAFPLLGPHAIQWVVDPDDSWPEYDESNNMYVQMLQVVCVREPELTVDAVEPVPPGWYYDPGDMIDSVMVRVSNLGLADAIGVHARLTLDGEPRCEDLFLGDIPGGGQQWISCPISWVVPDELGTVHWLVACADPGDVIPEWREDNNCATRDIHVGEIVPAVLTDLEAMARVDGLLLRWRALPGFASFGVERRPAAELVWERLSTVPVLSGEPSRYAHYSYLDPSAEPGKTYEYRVLGLDQGSDAQVLGVVQVLFAPPLPADLTLHQNAPNPFNPVTRIRLAVPERQNVTVRIFDSAGRFIVELWNGPLDPGYHTLTWNGRDSEGHQATSGTYFCTATARRGTQTKKLVLLK